ELGVRNLVQTHTLMGPHNVERSVDRTRIQHEHPQRTRVLLSLQGTQNRLEVAVAVERENRHRDDRPLPRLETRHLDLTHRVPRALYALTQTNRRRHP